ncbi:MAG: hypothetical protein H8E49_07985 [Gammaproteobacteria bacterium]|nr:hypothetical protein [Gammaproteobacteria bacterium]
MEIWIWFDENEGILSGIAAALVIFGALSTAGLFFGFSGSTSVSTKLR